MGKKKSKKKKWTLRLQKTQRNCFKNLKLTGKKNAGKRLGIIKDLRCVLLPFFTKFYFTNVFKYIYIGSLGSGIHCYRGTVSLQIARSPNNEKAPRIPNSFSNFMKYFYPKQYQFNFRNTEQ